ncbi:MAG: methyltransferase domain-containing protein [Dehalococcoidia bacterium]|nr:methyltransferase domain-containing protein [Dehalococcoidia bacterium]
MNDELGPDGGWAASAPAWIEGQARDDDPNRVLLLDPVMLELSGPVEGKRVLDLGCGEGRFSRMLAQRGARVVGLDLIAEMVIAAQGRVSSAESYVQATAESVPFADSTFDLVVSYVSLVDIPDFRAAIHESARVLRQGGRFLVANLNFASASLIPSWARDEDGRRLFMRIDRYADEYARVLEWAGVKILNWHRPLSAYMKAYLEADLLLREYLEPVPSDESLRDDPSTEDWFRVPIFDVMVWEKP